MSLRRLTILLALGFAAACGPSEPLKATTVQVGKSLNSDDSINAFATTFKPHDTIYAAVISTDPGKGTVGVRWVYAGQTVTQESREVSYNREGATAFHLQPPSAGFPVGDYRAEFTVNGEPAGMREFRVVE